MTKRTFQIYRYDPDKDAKPYMQTIEVELDGNERMLLDALMKLKAQDPTISPSAAPAAKASAARTR
jgi:succinate dehydrogenase / fumarate reductase iron-sulfur subunit